MNNPLSPTALFSGCYTLKRVAAVIPIFLMISIFFSCTSEPQLNRNNLDLETSAYLLQHANNPIHWQRWNKNLYGNSNKEEKLLVVSIGYSSCHWCHVMEKETFENEEVATFMNDKFISIKVDREENPEIDNIYMTATQMMTGSGGWPLNVVCLPDGRPVYGGTYHTKDQWLEVLGKIQKLYENDKTQLYGFAEKVEKGIQEVNQFEYTQEAPAFEPDLLTNEMAYWSREWDRVYGGEQQTQKFIIPVKFNYIQQYQFLNPNPDIESYLEHALITIANSGIFDQLEGGFFRYTVDPKWEIPHFEKMLFDNAQLLTLYANAYKQYKNPLFKKRVYQTFDFLNQKMENSEGAFYSAIDADNNEGEGRYYVFDEKEIKRVAGEDLTLLADYYKIDLNKPFEESFFHLQQHDSLQTILKKYGLSEQEINQKKVEWESAFENLKQQREFPLIDNKIITSWNAQLVSGLLTAYEAFQEDAFLKQAEATYRFIQNQLVDGKNILHTFQNGEAKLEGNLEDYAFTIQAALALYKNTGNIDYLTQADKLTKTAIQKFENPDNPFFTFTENPVLFSNIIAVDDNVIPSANAIMAENLWLLGELLDTEQYKEKAQKMLEGISSYFSGGRGSDYSQWAQLISKKAYSVKEVVIVGTHAKELAREFQSHYLPHVVFQMSEEASELPLLKDRYFEEETLIYVCENKVCLRPVKAVTEALKQIQD
ncbi:MAG: thioredoxin domain-containing protein [Bacteroidetes bacterium]|nr:thioredoxin domain-containing protein [Bacteroidota bacterium]